MRRDDEIRRLVKYSEGLGLKVSFRRHKKGNAGALWIINPDDSTELCMYEFPGQTKTRMILNFIHELAHHMSWVYNDRKLEPKLLTALNMVDDVDEVPKKTRRIIYEMERDDAEYRDSIIKELDIRIPQYKIKADKDVDIWFYKQYYLTGKYPTFKSVQEKYRKLCKEYKDASEN